MQTPDPASPADRSDPAARPWMTGADVVVPEGDDVERVVLLSEVGEAVGTEAKATVHHRADEGGTALHLAFSCHVYDDAGRFLLTRRALGKKAFPGVWTNGFCGHPGPGESPAEAVLRRAPQELGVPVRDVVEVLPDFRYRAVDASGMEEHEVCPVFRARMHGDPAPERDEVAEWCWVEPAELTAALAAVPRAFSPWLVEQWQQGAFEGR